MYRIGLESFVERECQSFESAGPRAVHGSEIRKVPPEPALQRVALQQEPFNPLLWRSIATSPGLLPSSKGDVQQLWVVVAVWVKVRRSKDRVQVVD